jgi:hypothetical protein
MDDVMPLRAVDWEANKVLPVRKGATVQQFLATVGKDKLEINVAPRGEGQQGRVVDVSLERLSGNDAGFVLDIPSNGPARRAPDEKGGTLMTMT